jgi:predicted DNA-binding protein (MmcQ/YjbR family)
MSKVHWNTVAINNAVSDSFVIKLIDHSYDLVFKKLTKKLQNEILEMEN